MMNGAIEKKKRKRASPEDIETAVRQVKTGRMTVRQASATYGVPKSTLGDHITGKRVRTSKGQEPYLGKELEDRLAAWLIKMARIGFGQTKEQLFGKAQQLVTQLGIATPFPNGRPMDNWYRCFMNRYPELSKRQPMILSKKRAGISREAVNQWFDELHEYITDIGHGDILTQPTRMFNADETGFPLAPKPLKVIAAKGDPHIYQQGSSSKTQITCLLAHNAFGQFVHPMFVFPGKNFRQDFMERFYHYLPNATFGRLSNGWMDAELFLTWLDSTFDTYVTEKHIPRPVLLIVDGAKVHISLEISEFCDAHNIILYILLPNSTHLIQPLDLVVMGSVKSIYRNMVRRWIMDNPFRGYDRNSFLEVIGKVFEQVCTQDKGQKGFEVAGIYPWNPTRVDDKKLIPADLYDRRYQINLPNIRQPTETVAVETVTPVPDETVTPVPDDIQQEAKDKRQEARSIVLDGIVYDLVVSPVAVRTEKDDVILSPKRAETAPSIPSTPSGPLTSCRPSTSSDPSTSTTPNSDVIVIDELLATPKQPRQSKPQPRQRVSGLPRAVSDNRFREMLKKQKEDKE